MGTIRIVTTWTGPGNEGDRVGQNLSDLTSGGRHRLPVSIISHERPGAHGERYQGRFRRGAARHEIVKPENTSFFKCTVILCGLSKSGDLGFS